MAFPWLVNGGYQPLTSPGMILQVVLQFATETLEPGSPPTPRKHHASGCAHQHPSNKKNMSTTSTFCNGCQVNSKKNMVNWHPVTEPFEMQHGRSRYSTWWLKHPFENILGQKRKHHPRQLRLFTRASSHDNFPFLMGLKRPKTRSKILSKQGLYLGPRSVTSWVRKKVQTFSRNSHPHKSVLKSLHLAGNVFVKILLQMMPSPDEDLASSPSPPKFKSKSPSKSRPPEATCQSFGKHGNTEEFGGHATS